MKYLYKNLIFLGIFIFSITDTHAVNCEASVNNFLVFGQYNPTIPGNYDTKTTLNILCKPNAKNEWITLRVKTVGNYGENSFRKMKNPKNENLYFRLYKDQNYSIPIDDETDLFHFSGNIKSDQDFNITIYGRIYSFQNSETGNYKIVFPIFIEWKNSIN